MEIENHSNSTVNSSSLQQDEIRQIIFQIRRLMQAGYQYTKDLNKNYHVSAPQLNCLLALYEMGPLPPSQIARHIMVKSSTVTGVIDRLEFKELVRRTRNSRDRRVITIELTETGKALAQNSPPPIQQKIVDGLKRLQSDQLQQMVHYLSLLTHMLDVQEIDDDHPEESHSPL